MITYDFGKDGSFVAGDTETSITAYAYPTSPQATKAKKSPLKVAKEMINLELEVSWTRKEGAPAWESAREYDARNWRRLMSRRIAELDTLHASWEA